MSAGWAAAAQAVADLVSGVTQNVMTQHSSRKAQYRQARLNKEFYNYQLQKQEEFYNKYQSPQAMMQQYKDAGLNPNLIYGNATAGSPDAGTPHLDTPNISAHPYNFDFLSSAVTSYFNQEMAERDMQVREKNAETNFLNYLSGDFLRKSQADLNDTKRLGVEVDTASGNIFKDFLAEYLRDRNESQKLRNVHQQGMNTIQNYEYTLLTTIKTDIMKEELENMKRQGRLSEASYNKAMATIGLIKSQAALVSSQTKGIQMENNFFENNPLEYYLKNVGPSFGAFMSGKLKAKEVKFYDEKMQKVWDHMSTQEQQEFMRLFIQVGSALSNMGKNGY